MAPTPTTTTALLVAQVGGPFKLTPNIQLAALEPDEALVEIHAVGLCHTDLACAAGQLPGGANAVYGHEGGGTVLEVGSQITHVVAPGDRVLLSFYHCGACELCLDGHPAYCVANGGNFRGRRPNGTSAMTLEDGKTEVHGYFFGQSSFAQKTIVNVSSIVKVPPNTDLELYCPLGCGIQTGAGSVLNTLDARPGASLAVFGAGSVGMAAIMAGKLRGCNPIVAVDLLDERLEMAKTLGATHVVNGKDEKVVEKIQEIIKEAGGKKNGAEFAVDCTGVPAVINKMILCLGIRGKGCTVGAPPPGAKAEVDVFYHLAMGKEYVGCCEGDSVPSKFIPYLMEQHAAGNFPLEKIITRYDMKDFEKAIKDSEEGRALKAVLTW